MGVLCVVSWVHSGSNASAGPQIMFAQSQNAPSRVSKVRPEPCMYGVCTVYLAGESPNIRSFTVCIYIHGSGRPYADVVAAPTSTSGLSDVNKRQRKLRFDRLSVRLFGQTAKSKEILRFNRLSVRLFGQTKVVAVMIYR